jgi:CheY-like chemotaxis protein
MPKKILVVDDEPDTISFLTSILEEHGYDHISACDGVEGLELAQNEKPDLILLDLIMPEKGGIIMFQELRKDPDLSNIPVIIVSGASEVTGVDFRNFIFKQPHKEEKRAVETTGVARFTEPNAFVEKPVKPPELIKRIEETLKA